MKVIDLLNKIANGEEIPNKFEYVIYGYEFEYDTNHKRYETYIDEEICGLGDFIEECNLNDEIEVIEEPKKVEKIKEILRIDDLEMRSFNEQKMWENIIIEQNKINEIIDYINKGE